jgi:signal transduction histidine kinase
MNPDSAPNRRVLLVDDNRAIYDDFRRILVPRNSAAGALDSAAAALFGEATVAAAPESAPFDLDYAQQGAEACDKAKEALAAGRPYALAFVDMRMPPGWDGLTTIRQLWEIDPEIQAVICTAYSDRSWSEIQTELTARDRWLVLKKPFDKVEVLQLAQALTEKWNLGRASRQHLATLEERVTVRTEQLRQAMQVKNEFLANVTHELLTPMNGVIGMLALMRDGALTSEQRACLADASTSADRLNQLLTQIIAFNQAEAGTLALQPVPFRPAALLDEVAGVYRARAAHKGVALQVKVAPGVPDFPAAPVAVLREILLALVDNAVKFTTRGTVTLAVGGDANRLDFRVQDTGSGLTPQQVRWIDLPFAQVDGGLNRRHGGIGLGLPMAKRLTGSLGGELSLQSEPGVGTTVAFSAVIPAGRESGGASAAS